MCAHCFIVCFNYSGVCFNVCCRLIQPSWLPNLIKAIILKCCVYYLFIVFIWLSFAHFRPIFWSLAFICPLFFCNNLVQWFFQSALSLCLSFCLSVSLCLSCVHILSLVIASSCFGINWFLTTGWRNKNGTAGHPISLQIFRKLHDRTAWKLVDFCNIICWTQSLTFCLKISSRCGAT